MPAFPGESPPEGESVDIVLANGVTLSAFWQGGQWWAGLNGNPNDVPIDNDYVVSWEPIA